MVTQRRQYRLLLDMPQACRCRLLLDVDSADFAAAAPLEPATWRGWQATAAERGRAALLTSWHPRATEARSMLSRAARSQVFAS